MEKTEVLAAWLREQARWRMALAARSSDDTDARSAVALLDAAAYVADLPPDDPEVCRLIDAGCLIGTMTRFGDNAVRLIRNWSHRTAGPREILRALATVAERESGLLRG
ncbi:MAG: hypothetical protein GEV11_07240 [Streptosporangiales bacterium]|nr:hypothetical protein [Streptosporangiales bacterium]